MFLDHSAREGEGDRDISTRRTRNKERENDKERERISLRHYHQERSVDAVAQLQIGKEGYGLDRFSKAPVV